MTPFLTSFLSLAPIRLAVADMGTHCQTVALPITCILFFMTSTFSAGVDPHWLSSRDHLGPRGIHVTVGPWSHKEREMINEAHYL